MVNFYNVDLLRALLKIVDEVVAEARPKHESIAVFTTRQQIVACASLQPVGISPSIYDIVTAKSIDRVLALAACNEIVGAGRQRPASDFVVIVDVIVRINGVDGRDRRPL